MDSEVLQKYRNSNMTLRLKYAGENLLKEFNLVISTYRGRENDCISELWYFLRDLGDPRVEASRTGLPGLIVAKTSLNPLEVVEKFSDIFKERPWEFRFILKVVPIEAVVKAILEEISKTALSLAEEKIKENETYKIVVRKRLTDLRREEIIESIATKLNRKVNLTTPDKIVVVEIIGDYAGVSVLEEKHIFSPQKMRRSS
ncbi:MAG TPA: hypothetical protein ENF87_01565 [Thermoproteales archaeon]|nr:hypothetical protein [Thermoproteales archaeon]